MLHKKQINKIIADAYYTLAQHTDVVDMRRMTELLESFRSQVKEDRPLETWYCLKLDATDDESGILVPVLVKMRTAWLSNFLTSSIELIHETCKKSKEEGWNQWLIAYTDAAINFYGEIHGPLCEEIFAFSEEKKFDLDNYKKLNRWILENRWVDAHPLYSRLAQESALSPYQKASLGVIIGEIELYYFPDSKVALPTLEKAKQIDKENRKVEKAFAEYDLQCGDSTTAKSRIAGLLLQYNDDYALYNLMGDCYKKEKSYATAEQFYKDGCKQNILQTESYSSLIKLYTEIDFFKEKENEILPVLDKVKQLETSPAYNNNLYNTYRDAGAGYMANDRLKEAEKFYNKAISLNKSLITAYIDKAYVKFRQGKAGDSETLLLQTLSIDPDCFDTYWALSYLYEGMEGKTQEAINAYEKCGQLRPAWADQVNNFIGNIYFKNEEYEKALSCFEAAIKLNPLPVYTENRTDALINIAKQKEKDGKSEEAEQMFSSIDTSGNADALNTIGDHYSRSGKYEKAIEYFNRAIAIKDDVGTFYENLGVALEESGKDEEAEKAYLRACELENEFGSPFNTLGYFYFLRKEWDKAIMYYTKAFQKDSHDTTYLQNLVRAHGDSGNIDLALDFSLQLYNLLSNAENQAQYAFYLAGAGQLDEALIQAKAALKKDKENLYAIKTAASIYEKTGDTKKAIELYKYAIEKSANKDDYANNQLGVLYYRNGMLNEAVSCYKAAIDINPATVVYHDNLALAHEGLGLFTEAENGYKTVIGMDPQNATNYNNLGVVQFKQGKLEEAEANYHEAIKIAGEQPVYLENLAVLYRQKGDREKAIEYFEKLISADPGTAVNQNDLGVLYFQQGDIDKAIERYNKAIELRPEVPLYYENTGIAYEAKKDNENALKNYEKALALEQNKPRMFNRLGIFYYNSGDFQKAIEYYKLAVTGDTKNEIYIENMVLALIQTGDFREEEKYLKQLIKINPEHFNAWNERGIVAYKKEKNKEAIEYYEKAASINGEYSTVYENIGLAYAADKNYEKAIAYFQKALDMNPENGEMLKARIADSYNNLAKYDKSIPLYEEILKTATGDITSLKNLELAYKAIHDDANAIRIQQIIATEDNKPV